MRALIVAALAAHLAGCSSKPVYAAYSKGPPRHVAVSKQATAPVPVFEARIDGSSIRVVASRESDVSVTRRVARSTYAIEGRGSWAWEWIETIASIFVLPALPTQATTLADHRAGPESKRGYVVSLMQAIVDPRRTLIGVEYTGRVLDEDYFPDDPTIRRYAVSLPIEGAVVGYRVLSITRATLAAGRATTSALGELEIDDVPDIDRAVAVELEIDGARFLIVLERG